MIIIILLTFVLSILFKIKGYNNLKFKINEIIKNIKYVKLKKNPPKKSSKINIMNTNDEVTNRSDNKLELLQSVVNNNTRNNNKLFLKIIRKK